MSDWINQLFAIIFIGAGATLVTDLWALIRRSWFGTALPNFGLVGRWIGHMGQGKFRHDSIAAAAPIRGESCIGWVAHYLIGIAFAALLIGIFGPGWLQQPQLVPALLVGIGTVAAPFLLMQPGMGAGIAASRTAHPARARMQSFITHAVFGLGLYLAGWLIS
jgi:hypothetical protein